MPPPDATARTADLHGDAPPEPPPLIPPPDATARTASPRAPATARRRRWVGAAALAALATLAAVAAVAAPAAAHPDPAPGETDPDKVWPPGVAVDPDPTLRQKYGYVRVPGTQTVTPAHDFVRVPFVRVPPGGTFDLHYRDNDSVRFKVCPTTNTPEQCRTDPSLHESAGGTCGDAVRYANGDARAGPFRGHHHVITLCSGVYSLGGLGMLSGSDYAGVKPKRGAITGTHTDGTAPRGVIEVEGKKLGVAEAEYCMTARPHPCRRWARIDIVVEPDGWTDARVVGVDEAYRLELNWQDRQAVLMDPSKVGDPVVETMCCISDLRYWTFDLRLPVMLGSERITRGRDAVVFYDATDTEVGRMQCLPRYCEQIVPKNPTVTSAGTIGVDAEVVGRNLHVTLWDNPDLIGVQAGSRGTTTTLITYCLAHWQQRCDASTCAKATYRDAPNLTLAPWMNVVPSSAYVATTNCPAPATVRIDVADVTPPSFDLGDFSPATEQDPPDPADPADPEDPPDWQYRPLPAQFDPASTSADKTYWCFPGRFLDSAIGDLEGDAGRWVDNPATQHVARTRQIRFTRYMAGEDAAGNNVPEWAALPARERTDPGDTARVTNRDVLIPQIVDREYEALRRDPGEFPERDPTLGEVWRWAAEEVHKEFVDDFANNFEAHYLAVTAEPDRVDPIPTPATPPNLDEFILNYVTPGGQYHASRFDYDADRDGEVLDRYDATFAREWERGPLWQGLLRSAYRGADGGLEQGVGRVYLVDRPLLENPGAQSRSCLAEGLVDMKITGVWGTYPGADNWGEHLCGYGLPTTSTAIRRSNERDPDCPDNAPVPGRGDASLPAIWLRDDPDTPAVYDPSLGEAWERALEAVTPCVEPPQCDTWAPPIPGYYQVRVEITRRPDNPFKDACGSIPSFGYPRPGDRAPRPECAYHHWLTESTLDEVANKGWTDYWGPPPETDPAPTIIFHDLIWVTDVRVDAVG